MYTKSLIKYPYEGYGDFNFGWRINKIESNKTLFSSILYEDEIFKKDSIYLRMASIWAENSKCKRKKVGCLIVRDKLIISDGYNGTPSGFNNCCEDLEGNSLSEVVHAEANAITKLAMSTQSSIGATIYITLSPCFECSKLIIQSGIKRIVFTELYRNLDSLEFLAYAGVEVVKINLNR